MATAPTGYGKTVFLKQLGARLPAKGVIKIGLSLGPAHRDFGVFVDSLAAALKAQSFTPPDWRGRPEEMAARLANAFAQSSAPLYLMLDDYHAAAGPDLDSFVRALVGAGNDAVHVAIATRARAKVGAPVLAARGDLTSLGAVDLAFLLEETQRLFAGRLTAEDAAALYVETEGWPAAVQLAGHATREEAVGAAVRSAIMTTGEVGALVREETFDPLPEALRDLLVETAYLETLDADDVDRVRGRGDAAALLADLEGSGALVFPDRDQPGLLRRHALLRRFLETRFTLLDADRRREITDRTLSCLARTGEVRSALRLMGRSTLKPPSLALLESAPVESLWTAEALLDLPGDLSGMSEAVFAGAPRMSLLRGVALYAEGRVADARAAIEAGLTEMRAGEANGAGPRAAGAARDRTVWEGLRAAIFEQAVSSELFDELATMARLELPPASRALAAHTSSVLALRAGRSEEARAAADLIGAEDDASPAALELGAVSQAVAALSDASPQRSASALARLDGAAIGRANLAIASRLCAAWLAYESGAPWKEADLPPFDAPPLLLGLSPELFVEGARLSAAGAHWSQGLEAATAILEDARSVALARGWRRADALLEAETLNLYARAGMRGAATRPLAEKVAQHEKGGLAEAALALARFDASTGAYKRARARIAALLAAPSLTRRRKVEALIIDACAANALGQEDDVILALGKFLAMSEEGVMARCFHEDGLGLWEPLMTLASKMATLDPDNSCLDVVADLAVSQPFCEGGLVLAAPTQQESAMFAALRRTGSRAGAANDLSIPENTVKFYLRRVFVKWRVRDWRLAMRIAERTEARTGG